MTRQDGRTGAKGPPDDDVCSSFLFHLRSDEDMLIVRCPDDRICRVCRSDDELKSAARLHVLDERASGWVQ